MNYKCPDCEAEFNEQDQTNYEHENGICPLCGGENIKEVA